VINAYLLKQSRKSSLPPWWKWRTGREVGGSFSLNIRRDEPSFFTVIDLRSHTLKVKAHLLFSCVWFNAPGRKQRNSFNFILTSSYNSNYVHSLINHSGDLQKESPNLGKRFSFKTHFTQFSKLLL
jgi:hypothetical protein